MQTAKIRLEVGFFRGVLLGKHEQVFELSLVLLATKMRLGEFRERLKALGPSDSDPRNDHKLKLNLSLPRCNRRK